MDDLKRVAQQFAQAAQVGPIATPIPEMASYFKSAFMEPIVKQGIAGPGQLAGQKAQEADEADEAARKAAIDAIQKKMDPGNFTKQRKADGGFAFFDPDGKEIGIDQFTQATGKSRLEVLSDSENPVDLNYIDDFKRMREAMQVMYGGDEQEKKDFLDQNPQLKKRKIQDFAADLIKKYPHIYGKGGTGGQAYQQTLRNQKNRLFSLGSSGTTSSSSSSSSGGSGKRRFD